MKFKFGVNHWGSHPDDDNDDCYSGSDFVSYEDAYNEFWSVVMDPSVAYIELVKYVGTHMGMDAVEPLMVRNNCGYQPEREDDWRKEQAMEAGMLHGVDAYNERMGYI